MNILLRASLLLMVAAFMFVPAQAIELNFGKLKNTFKKVKQATGDIPQAQEIKIGSVLSATLLGAAPLVKDAELQAYVNRIGVWVAQQSHRKDLPWHFAVIESDNINAFAAPGGFVLLTKGLFLELNNEAELAAVLGHEIGHVIHFHHINAMQKNARLNLVGDVLVASSQEKNRKKLDKIVNAGTQLYARGLDREDEHHADRVGVVLAARAGYDPYAFLDVLATLDSINPQAKSLALIMKTHPPFSERLKHLDVAMEGRMGEQAGDGRLQQRFLTIKQQLLTAERSAPKS